jgi:hypothetical protein
MNFNNENFNVSIGTGITAVACVFRFIFVFIDLRKFSYYNNGTRLLRCIAIPSIALRECNNEVMQHLLPPLNAFSLFS